MLDTDPTTTQPATPQLPQYETLSDDDRPTGHTTPPGAPAETPDSLVGEGLELAHQTGGRILKALPLLGSDDKTNVSDAQRPADEQQVQEGGEWEAFKESMKAGLYRANAGLTQTGGRVLEYFGSDDARRKEQERKAKSESRAMDTALEFVENAYPKSVLAGDIASDLVATAPTAVVGGGPILAGSKALMT